MRCYVQKRIVLIELLQTGIVQSACEGASDKPCRSQLAANVLGFILADFPRLVREQWRFVLIASLLFFGSLLGIALLVYLFPELIYSLVDADQVASMEQMYDPDARRLGRFGRRNRRRGWGRG